MPRKLAQCLLSRLPSLKLASAYPRCVPAYEIFEYVRSLCFATRATQTPTLRRDGDPLSNHRDAVTLTNHTR